MSPQIKSMVMSFVLMTHSLVCISILFDYVFTHDLSSYQRLIALPTVYLMFFYSNFMGAKGIMTYEKNPEKASKYFNGQTVALMCGFAMMVITILWG